MLHHRSLKGDGPHHFHLEGNAGPAAVTADRTQATHRMRVLPPRIAVTLHYESCDYARWQNKFREVRPRGWQGL